MGNNSLGGIFDSRAQFQHGNMVLQIDNPFTYAGENLTGTIYIQMMQPYPAVSLDIEIRGDEKWSWDEVINSSYTDSNGNTK